MDRHYSYTRKPVHTKWTCPRGCGYYRVYQLNNWWLTDTLIHPLHGKISEAQLVQLDISGHDCRMYLEARKRITERDGTHVPSEQDRKAHIRRQAL